MTMTKRATILGIRRSAIIEMALFFLIVLGLDLLFVDGSRFLGMSPHPFWAIVLLIAAQYGTSEALCAAMLSTLFLYAGNLPEQQMGQDSYQYVLGIITTPLLWFISAVTFGELRNKHIRERNRLMEELRIAREREETIANSYQRVKERKEQLELRITGQLRSSIEAYRAARKIESLHPTELFPGIVELIKAVLGPQKFSLFQLESSMLTLVVASGWDNENEYPRIVSSKQLLFSEIVSNRNLLCVANPEQERVLAGEAVLAAPLIDKASGQVMGMFKVEDIGFTELNLSAIQTFAALCEWIGMAISNARQYQTLKSDSMVNPDHNLMTHSFFARYTDHITSLAKRARFDVTMITVKLANPGDFDSERRHQIARTLANCVDKTLRNVDLAFDYHPNGEEFAIVLPATDKRGAESVLSKITKELQDRLPKTLRAQFATSVQALGV